MLAKQPQAFAGAITEKMLIYALGRGLEAYDRPTVKAIMDGLTRNDYQFSTLVMGIVNSVPFQRADYAARIKSAAKTDQSQELKMLVTRKSLSRRTLLKGLGTAVALPFLDSWCRRSPHPTLGATQFPNRLFFTYIPIGAIMDEWYPTGGETGFEFKRILKPVQAFREDLTVLGGLDHHTGYALGDGGGTMPAPALLSDRRASQEDLGRGYPRGRFGGSDHCRANGQQDAFRFARTGLRGSRTVGACDSGYSCAYQNSVSWRTPTSPMPPETESARDFRAHVRTEV